ncbi:MAG: hypothetical protein AMJ90_06905 [candidate division Zixibacteria bacterium SM23_73_2]|nr:MAG: hypothetical protein AMJ90_06905 [candidate division Zixibacteria bacterium SM23_73_2]
MLGRLYKPKGRALETAQQVLQINNPMAVNVAWGCTNRCQDCYIRYIKTGHIRYPKTEPFKLVEQQFKSGLKPDGVFISFETDPLLQQHNLLNTFKLVSFLKQNNIPVAVLSKMGVIPVSGVRHGVTLKSHEEKFRKKFEPNALSIEERIRPLRVVHNDGEYTWVSDEPHPCPAIYKQDDYVFWEYINFVDFIIFGMWNYNSLAKTEEAREYYADTIIKFKDFCKDYGIRYWIKNDTLKFITKE